MNSYILTKHIYMSDIHPKNDLCITGRSTMIIDTVFSISVASSASFKVSYWKPLDWFCIEYDPKYLYISTLALCFLVKLSIYKHIIFVHGF